MKESTFKEGYSFSGNFYKIGTNPNTGLRHYGMWNEIDAKDPHFHMPEFFGLMKIAEQLMIRPFERENTMEGY